MVAEGKVLHIVGASSWCRGESDAGSSLGRTVLETGGQAGRVISAAWSIAGVEFVVAVCGQLVNEPLQLEVYLRLSPVSLVEMLLR